MEKSFDLRSLVGPAIAGGIITILFNLISYAATSPMTEIAKVAALQEKHEDRLTKIEREQVAKDEQYKSLKEALVDLKTGQALSNSKLDDVKSELAGIRGSRK